MTFIRHGFIITIKKNRERKREKKYEIQISKKSAINKSHIIIDYHYKERREREREKRNKKNTQGRMTINFPLDPQTNVCIQVSKHREG